MRQGTVSGIVPVRDGERYIGAALESILGQTRLPDQIVVVDDGSQDRSAEIATGYGDRVTCIRREPRGVGAAIDSGLEASDCELVAFLDADDLWTPAKLELQVAALDRDPDLDMVFGHVEQFISPDLSDEQRARLRPPPSPAPGKVKGTMLIRRAALDRVGAFATSAWKVADFVEWYVRATERGLRETMVDDVILRRRIHEANSGRTHSESRVEYAQVLGAALRRGRSGLR